MTTEPFRLSQPPATRRATTKRPRQRQGVLFSGMDCLSGQKDLFETDGPQEGFSGSLADIDPKPSQKGAKP